MSVGIEYKQDIEEHNQRNMSQSNADVTLASALLYAFTQQSLRLDDTLLHLFATIKTNKTGKHRSE